MNNYDRLIKAGIDTDALIRRLMGNEALIRVFIGKFIDDTTFRDLKTAFEENDARKAEIASHTLKGVCGNLSVEVLYRLFTEQTNLIRSGAFSDARNMMPDITKAYDNAIEEMTLWLSEN